MRILMSLLMVATLSGCKRGSAGNAAEAVVALTMAATVSAIQAARARSPDRRSTRKDCTHICGPCEVPCGDECLPYGTACLSKPGRACWESVPPSVPEPEPPDICPAGPGFYIDFSS
jgi:hypothetical protein